MADHGKSGIWQRLRDWWLGTSALAPAPPERKVMAVSAQAVATAGLARALRHADDPLFHRPAAEIFAPYKQMPGIAPSGMAMDSAPAAGVLSAWAAQGVLSEGQAFFGYPYLAELQQRAEYRHACEIWAEHAVRKWIKLTGGTEAQREQIEEKFDELDVRSVVQLWCYHDQAYGRAQIFLNFGDDDNDVELATPLRIDKTKISKDRPLKQLVNVEPLWSAPGTYATSNPLRGDFYKPSTWFVYGHPVNATRMLTLVGRPVSDMLKSAYAFGGLSLTQMMQPYVNNWLRSRQSASDMQNSYSIMNLSTDMSSVMGAGDGQSLFNRIDVFNQMRDNRGTFVTDKDNEELQNIAVPLSSVPELQAQSQEQLASAARIPLSIYLQITPTGLNATNDGETRNFYADVHSYQQKNVRPGLETILQCVQLSIWGKIVDDIQFEFEPLWEMSDKDKAEIAKSEAEADASYIDHGVISPEESRDRLNREDGGQYESLLDGPAPELPDEDEMGGESEDDQSGNVTGAADIAVGNISVHVEEPGGEDSALAAGVMCVAPDGRALFLKRSATGRDHPGEWCWPGGMIEPGEHPATAAWRETYEETGHSVMMGAEKPIDVRDGFLTFRADVPGVADARLNEEHDMAVWAYPSAPPEPLHPGVRATLEKLGAL